MKPPEEGGAKPNTTEKFVVVFCEENERLFYAQFFHGDDDWH